jgi:hypothetical protein
MITISEGLQAYRIYAQAAGHSKRTIGWIESSMRYFAEFLGDKQDISQITANDLRRFIIAWGQRPKFARHPFNRPQNECVSPTSVQTYARGIRAFFGHLASEDLLPINPMQKVKTPKVPTKAVPTFNADEVERLLRCPNRNTPTGFRDYALQLTFIDTEGNSLQHYPAIVMINTKTTVGHMIDDWAGSGTVPGNVPGGVRWIMKREIARVTIGGTLLNWEDCLWLRCWQWTCCPGAKPRQSAALQPAACPPSPPRKYIPSLLTCPPKTEPDLVLDWRLIEKGEACLEKYSSLSNYQQVA